MKKVSGIYRIVCVANGNYYYGSSNNVWCRWGFHKRSLRKNNHHNIHMQQTWNKYGEDKFHIELVELVSSDKLWDAETIYLKDHVGKPHCMNISIDAYSPTRGRKTGPCSEETKLKIRNALLGHTVSKKTRKKIGDARKGKIVGPYPIERRSNIAKARRPNGFPKVKSPDGTVYDIHILEDFCKQHALHPPAMSYLVNGKLRSHRKWTLAS